METVVAVLTLETCDRQDGDKKHVEALAIRLRDHGGMRRFNKALFECLDHQHEDIACVLIKLGFSTEVYKQVRLHGLVVVAVQFSPVQSSPAQFSSVRFSLV